MKRVQWMLLAAPFARASGSPPPRRPDATGGPELNRFFYYPYYYYPHNYWPSQGPQWPEPPGPPYQRPPAYMAYPPFNEPRWHMSPLPTATTAAFILAGSVLSAEIVGWPSVSEAHRTFSRATTLWRAGRVSDRSFSALRSLRNRLAKES